MLQLSMNPADSAAVLQGYEYKSQRGSSCTLIGLSFLLNERPYLIPGPNIMIPTFLRISQLKTVVSYWNPWFSWKLRISRVVGGANWSKTAVFGLKPQFSWKLQISRVVGGANWSKTAVFGQKPVFMKIGFQGLWGGANWSKTAVFSWKLVFGSKARFSSKTGMFLAKKLQIFSQKTWFLVKYCEFSRVCVTFEFKTRLVFQNFSFGPKTMVFVVLCTQFTPFKTIWPNFIIVYTNDSFKNHLTQYYHCVPYWLLSRSFNPVLSLCTLLTPFKTI